MQISGPHTEAPALTLLGQASEFVFVPQDSITSVDTTLVDRKQDRNLEPSMFLPLVYETFPITLSKLYQQTSKEKENCVSQLVCHQVFTDSPLPNKNTTVHLHSPQSLSTQFY